MKKLVWSLVVLSLLHSSDASAQPQAQEIAFVSNCAQGVHVYDKTANAVTCGKPAASGSGYVIEMATDAASTAQCPQGYSFVGKIKGSMHGDSLQHFACVKS
ncbi:MAG: hypothetical protein EB059_05370 [Alphaproteobacteria bacterium]|nr:hypothetical protein [Alphaproteobacteria bacterium]